MTLLTMVAIRIVRFRILTILFFLLLASMQLGFADTFIVSDTEGSISKIETLVKEGKLKWVSTAQGKRLDFVNSKDALVFLGDLSGPNWLDPANPHNIFLRDVFLDLKTQYPSRFDFVWGNHEANRLGFVRNNILMGKGQHVEYKQWLTEKRFKDSIEHRVTFWGTQTYGVNKEGVPLPVADYQRELSNTLGRKISASDAAERFAADLKVGKPGEPHGKLLQLLLTGQESTYRSGYSMTHAPIRQGATGIIPFQAKRETSGASWLKKRNDHFFRPQLDKFIKAAQNGEVPPEILPDLGDARWDSVGKRVVNDSASLTYTERARVGDQYRGVAPEVAERFVRDSSMPSIGMLTGHKPAGNYATVHRQEVSGKPFFDVVVDTSRGNEGMFSTVTLKDSGDLEMSGRTAEGSIEHWKVNSKTDRLVGKITEDGFHIKGVTRDNKYILERYVGYLLEEKMVPKKDIDRAKTFFSYDDPTLNKITREKIAALEDAIKAHGGQILNGPEEASRIVGDRFVLDLRGASKWAAVDEAKAQEIRTQLISMADRLDPNKVVIMTGGNRAGHQNAVENMVHDIFSGLDAKKQFDIIGFMKHDTPADEVDRAVRYIVMVGDGENWDGPVQAAQKFVSERRGATIMWGGGGILERAAETPTAAGMKNRLLMVQGFGGASENKAAFGVTVRSTEDIFGQLSRIDKVATSPAPTRSLKIGIFTGSFDPPHSGHKNIVDGMKKQFGLDVVYVVPDKTTAYKPGMQSYVHRKKMVQALFSNDPGIKVLSQGQEKALGAGELWDVTRVVKSENPSAKLYTVMGTDTLEWYRKLPAGKRDRNITILLNRRDRGAPVPSAVGGQKIIGVDLNDQGISSTQVRNELKSGVESKSLNPEVNQYIKKNGLYGPSAQTATPEKVLKAFKTKGKKVVTFIGYSGAEYQDKANMLEQVKKVLAGLDPKTTLINIGATPEGIGEVYKVAKSMGFETAGIVSSEAQKYGATLSSYVDHVYFVKDKSWGGFLPGTNRLSPTSQAMVGVSDEVVAIGGGEVGRDEMIAARRAGKPVQYFSADMNHELALQKALKKGLPAPAGFSGAAEAVMNPPVKTPSEIEAAFKAKGKKVVTFIGYSGAEYERPEQMLSQVRTALGKFDPQTTVVNIGATPEGIGKVYEVAKEMGFETTGIVSSQAKKYGGLSPYVDHAFYVEDKTWGGFVSGTNRLSPTSQAMVIVSDEVIGIGGGEVGRDEMIAARRVGKNVQFFPAEMNHEIAIKKAAKNGAIAPTKFIGAAAEALVTEVKSEAEIAAFFKERGKKVVTFLGYSGAEYNNKSQMLSQARRILERLDPKTTIINIGATPEGIGSVYQLAKGMGFETSGIVSAQAKKYGRLSPFVDHAFYVQDESWGGFKPGTKELSPTSRAMVNNSNQVIAIGGGDVARDELTAARDLGKPTDFFPADMNHEIAIKKAAKNGLPTPKDFRGSVFTAAENVRPNTASCISKYLELLLR